MPDPILFIIGLFVTVVVVVALVLVGISEAKDLEGK